MIRGIAAAGLALALAPDAAALSPVRARFADHFSLDCVVGNASRLERERLCVTLRRLAGAHFRLPLRPRAGPTGLALRVAVERRGTVFVGSMTGESPALTDETSARFDQAIAFDAGAPAEGWGAALRRLGPVKPPPTADIRFRRPTPKQR